mmetsp:Transcript_88241/g.189388  ORF Transcript_88241/g.189388 Transcript_88241/m.189388 type:complete len:417 (-) Transcript_88241:55-1305(-)
MEGTTGAAGPAGTASQAQDAPTKPMSICEKALADMRARGGMCKGELYDLPEDYGTSRGVHERYLPDDYSEAPSSSLALKPKQEGTIWTPEFHHKSSLTLGDIQKQMPKPDKLKDLVKYKGPASQKKVMDQATTNAELQKAIENGDPDMVAALLRYGITKKCVNVNAPLWPKRERMLHLAARKNYRDICIMLLEAKAELDTEEITDGMHPLHMACKSGSYDCVELLLDRKARIEDNNHMMWRPIHWASSFGHTDIVDLLLDRSARIDSVTSNQQEPLHIAAQEGHAGVVRLLCKRGANVDCETNCSQRPIHLACAAGKLEAAKALMDSGAMGVLDDPKVAMLRHEGTPLDTLMRTVEQLNFLRDEAEEFFDMGQQSEADEAFRQVVDGFVQLGLEKQAELMRSDAKRCGVASLEPPP